ncbi:MAG: PPOX class F420-dependent oxidoreductase [Thermomicrobiales bacterium]
MSRSTAPTPTTFTTVDHTGFVLLTTFKRDGTAVSAPVWAVRDAPNNRLLVITASESGKAKRIRANGRATLAPCNRTGTRLGADIPAHGLQLPPEDVERYRHLFYQRYGLMARGIFTFLRLRYRDMHRVLIELTPA